MYLSNVDRYAYTCESLERVFSYGLPTVIVQKSVSTTEGTIFFDELKDDLSNLNHGSIVGQSNSERRCECRGASQRSIRI